MVLLQDRKSLITTILRDEPARRLGKEAVFKTTLANRKKAQEDGTYKTKVICKREGQICKSDGILQAQSLWMLLVPKQMAAAII